MQCSMRQAVLPQAGMRRSAAMGARCKAAAAVAGGRQRRLQVRVLQHFDAGKLRTSLGDGAVAGQSRELQSAAAFWPPPLQPPRAGLRWRRG